MQPKTENALRHLVLLHAISSAGPEVHRAIMSGDDEQGLHDALVAHAKTLHDRISASAAGSGKEAPEAGESTASRAAKMFNSAPADGDGNESAVSKADKDSARKSKVGQLFKK